MIRYLAVNLNKDWLLLLGERKNMRKFLALGVIAVAVSAHASFSEDFETMPVSTTGAGLAGPENVALTSGTWVAHNMSSPVGTTGVFNIGTAATAHGGVSAAVMNFNSTTGTNTQNVWFFSPVITWAVGDTLSFWTFAASQTFPDRMHVKSSTNGASTNAADFTTNLLSINPGLATNTYPIAYTQFNIVMADAGTGRFAFHYDVTNGGPAGTNGNRISIDDVVFTNVVPEPATMALLGLGAVAALRRRNRK